MNLLVILNEKYFALVEKTCGQLRKPAQYCAAKLIHYFINWAKWKKQVQRTEWIYQKLKNIKADLLNEHSLHQIREAIAALMKTGCGWIMKLLQELSNALYLSANNFVTARTIKQFVEGRGIITLRFILEWD